MHDRDPVMFSAQEDLNGENDVFEIEHNDLYYIASQLSRLFGIQNNTSNKIEAFS